MAVQAVRVVQVELEEPEQYLIAEKNQKLT